jgi:excisionase family DNA binding protein
MAKRQDLHQSLRFVSSKIACDVLGVTSQTLRRWAKQAKIGAIKTPGGHYRYDLSGLIVAESPPTPPKPRATRKEPLQVALSEKIPAQNADSAKPAQLGLVEMVNAAPPAAVISAEALRAQIEGLTRSSRW